MFHRLASIAIFLIVASCGSYFAHSGRIADYNVSADRAANKILLLNIMRSSFRAPLHFSFVSQGTVGSRGSASVGFSIDPSSPSGVITPNFSFSDPSPDTTVQFDNAEKFANALAEPIQIKTAAALESQGKPRGLLLHLLIEKMWLADPASGYSRTYYNEPRSLKEMKEFRSTLNALIDLGLTFGTDAGASSFVGPRLTSAQAARYLSSDVSKEDGLALKRDGNGWRLQKSATSSTKLCFSDRLLTELDSSKLKTLPFGLLCSESASLNNAIPAKKRDAIKKRRARFNGVRTFCRQNPGASSCVRCISGGGVTALSGGNSFAVKRLVESLSQQAIDAKDIISSNLVSVGSMRVQMRSTLGVFDYLGSVAASQTRSRLNSGEDTPYFFLRYDRSAINASASNNTPQCVPHLVFQVKTDSQPKLDVVRADYAGSQYWVPSDKGSFVIGKRQFDQRAGQSLATLSQLLSLSREADEIPQVLTVAVGQ